MTNTSPARNRVTPFGDVVAAAARGAWTGNRGRLHDGHGSRDVVRTHETTRWITCLLSFGNRRAPQWEPGRYTHLFFVDEAVALAAGHRPCAECRRPDYLAYRAAWTAAHGGATPLATDMDAVLHHERTPVGADGRRRHAMPWGEVPDGAFVVVDDGPAVVVGDRTVAWDAGYHGYGRARVRPPAGTASVITPPSTVEVLRAGYPVQIAAQ